MTDTGRLESENHIPEAYSHAREIIDKGHYGVALSTLFDGYELIGIEPPGSDIKRNFEYSGRVTTCTLLLRKTLQEGKPSTEVIPVLVEEIPTLIKEHNRLTHAQIEMRMHEKVYLLFGEDFTTKPVGIIYDKLKRSRCFMLTVYDDTYLSSLKLPWGIFKDIEKSLFLRNAAAALALLHNNNIVHGDNQPKNWGRNGTSPFMFIDMEKGGFMKKVTSEQIFSEIVYPLAHMISLLTKSKSVNNRAIINTMRVEAVMFFIEYYLKPYYELSDYQHVLGESFIDFRKDFLNFIASKKDGYLSPLSIKVMRRYIIADEEHASPVPVMETIEEYRENT